MRRGPEGAQTRAAWYFLAPALVLIGLFFFLPVGASLLLSVRGLEPERRRVLVRRYSSIALDAVILLSVSGGARALGELRSVTQLWTTSYGVAILVKAALVQLVHGRDWRGRAERQQVVERTVPAPQR